MARIAERAETTPQRVKRLGNLKGANWARLQLRVESPINRILDISQGTREDFLIFLGRIFFRGNV